MTGRNKKQGLQVKCGHKSGKRPKIHLAQGEVTSGTREQESSASTNHDPCKTFRYVCICIASGGDIIERLAPVPELNAKMGAKPVGQRRGSVSLEKLILYNY